MVLVLTALAIAQQEEQAPIMINEARLPQGFPPPGPVAEVIIKHYPAYRGAFARSETAGANQLFGVLFRHIQQHSIPMTAPVEMTMDPSGQGNRPMVMAFLYEHPEQGTAGADGAVEVLDMQAVTVASVGLRGRYDRAMWNLGVAAIEAFLAQEDCMYEAVGPPRLLAYNSPFVPPMLRYGEVQIPVREKPCGMPAGCGDDEGS